MVNRQCECRKVHHVCIALHCIYYGDDYFRFFRQLWLRACVRVCVSMCHCRALALTLVRREHKHTLRLASSIILFTRSTRDSSFRSVCSGCSKGGRRIAAAPSTRMHVTWWTFKNVWTFDSFPFFPPSRFFSFHLLFSLFWSLLIDTFHSMHAITHEESTFASPHSIPKYDTFAWSRLLVHGFWTKEMPASCISIQVFPVLNPITISLFLWKKKSRHFRSLVLLSETRWKKKLKAHTHSHSHTVNMIRIDVGVCLMCKNALPWKTTTATTTTMERNAHIAFFESNMRRIAHLSEFAVYRKLLHFK